MSDNKHNGMDALFNGLTGSVQPSSVPTVNDGHSQPAQNHEKQKSSVKQLEERFCTIVDCEQLRKIRIIAARENLQIKEVVNAAFDLAIGEYEKIHGKIDGEIRGNPKRLFKG